MFPRNSQLANLYARTTEALLLLMDEPYTTDYQKRFASRIIKERRGEIDSSLVIKQPSKAQIRSRLLGQVRFHTRGMIGLIDNFSRSLKALYDTDADKLLVDVLLERIAYARAELTLIDIVGCEISTIAIAKRKATEIVLKSGTTKQEKSS